jgi:hypothetical protein
MVRWDSTQQIEQRIQERHLFHRYEYRKEYFRWDILLHGTECLISQEA